MKNLIIFVILLIHFIFNIKYINASGFDKSYSLWNGLTVINEAGFYFNTMQLNIDFSDEIWKDIKGFEKCHQISNKGNVRSLKKYIKHSLGNLSLRKMKNISVNTDRKGYNYVTLGRNRIAKTFKVHRLVALHFIPNPENKPEINHKNGIKNDNNINNLEWVTRLENERHAWNSGLKQSRYGEKNSRAKYTNKDAEDIRILYKQGYTLIQLAKKYNVSSSSISRCVNFVSFNCKK